MSNFTPGITLSERYYHEVVRPMLMSAHPGLAHAAALIGPGSEVLGFDTEMSTDHSWGPRLLLFLPEAKHAGLAATISETLGRMLPERFGGYPTGFAANDADPDRGERTGEGLINHRVEILTIRGFFAGYLDFDIDSEIEPADWLTFTEQKLRTLTAGAVYHDGIGLKAVLERFAYYPRDVWLYLLASGWTRIGQEEHLMGRAGFVGDELGSGIIASRLVRDLMRLCFLMERQYAPYPKWLGTAFRALRCGPDLYPVLQSGQAATTWQQREAHLVEAYEYVAAMHNRLGITEPLPTSAASFFGRPFRVIHLHGGFANAISRQIVDPAVQQFAARPQIGAIDQFSDSTDLLSERQWRGKLRSLFEVEEQPDGASSAQH